MIRKILIITLLIQTSLPIFSQTLNSEFIRAVQEADQYYYFDSDYEQAAGLYKKLYDKFPENCNLAAKLGICYLNLDGKKDESLVLLKKASSDIVKSDDQYVEYGEKAPLEVSFYLAYSYHLNDSLEKAIELYSGVRKAYNPTQAFRLDYIDNQIQACQYALEQQKNPVRATAVLFTDWLKDFPGASCPVVSENDSVFVFTVRKGKSNRIYCSYKEGSWSKPTEITQQLGNFENIYSNSITGNGSLLVLSIEDNGSGDLYYTTREGRVWSKIRKFGKEINTKYWEAHGFITPDGNKLFISSNRPGGVGELDIYVTEKDKSGNWGPVQNAGRTINTTYNENTPFFDNINSTLYFSSVGWQGMGDYDLFSSTLSNNRWSIPLCQPYPINNTSENLFFNRGSDNSDYVTSLVDKTNEQRNIYRINVSAIQSDNKIIAGGVINLQDGMMINPSASQILISKADSIPVWKKVEVNDSGTFSFVTGPGEYNLQVSYEGYKTDTLNLNIPDTYTGKTIDVNSTLIPERVISGDFISIKNILFDFNSHTLNGTAITELEKLRSVLSSLKDFKIEISGYTDSKGSDLVNKELAEKRASSVIEYLTSSGISRSHFIMKAIGAADFVAINTNSDGSDNPEGRKYNRRVTLGMIDSESGATIQQESYTPEHLRNPYSLKYSIVLMKSDNEVSPDHFSKLGTDKLLFVRPVKFEKQYLYVLGEFAEKSDAISFLNYSISNGYPESFIVNQYDLSNDSISTVKNFTSSSNITVSKVFAIQIQATRLQLKNNLFNGLKNVTEIQGIDGFYRYLYGEYDSYIKAKGDIGTVISAGYKDAFVREVNPLIDQKMRTPDYGITIQRR